MNPLLEKIENFRIINAVGYATRVGGSRPSPAVLDAMVAAQQHYFEVDDLLHLASRTISTEIGCEAGIVTCGAAAALTLGAAAIMARDDLDVMEALPDTSQIQRNEFLYPERNYYDYDHPIRVSGAKLRKFSFDDQDLERRLKESFDETLAGVIYVWKHKDSFSLIGRIARICREANVPFLLDGAMSLPPSNNLKDLAALGIHLIALSGGKHLGGPQNSGLLFGDADLIRSAWLQMVDMDVRPTSWSLSHLIEDKLVPRPPRHGLGRGYKVGKDTILGCLTALQLYGTRDFDAEKRRWHDICKEIADKVTNTSRLQFNYVEQSTTGQYPIVKVIASDENTLARFKKVLKEQPPKIILAEHESDQAVAFVYPMNLSDADVQTIIERFSSIASHEI